MSNNPAITQLIRGIFVQRPPVCKLIPSWDLFQVLSALSEAPFEPLAQASLIQLSIKVAFLLAVATTRRRSELHALTLEPGHIRWEPAGVRLIPNTKFLKKKNQSETFCLPDIFVLDIKSVSSILADRLWCHLEGTINNCLLCQCRHVGQRHKTQ